MDYSDLFPVVHQSRIGGSKEWEIYKETEPNQGGLWHVLDALPTGVFFSLSLRRHHKER